jgi:hypothetical protein
MADSTIRTSTTKENSHVPKLDGSEKEKIEVNVRADILATSFVSSRKGVNNEETVVKNHQTQNMLENDNKENSSWPQFNEEVLSSALAENEYDVLNWLNGDTSLFHDLSAVEAEDLSYGNAKKRKINEIECSQVEKVEQVLSPLMPLNHSTPKKAIEKKSTRLNFTVFGQNAVEKGKNGGKTTKCKTPTGVKFKSVLEMNSFPTEETQKKASQCWAPEFKVQPDGPCRKSNKNHQKLFHALVEKMISKEMDVESVEKFMELLCSRPELFQNLHEDRSSNGKSFKSLMHDMNNALPKIYGIQFYLSKMTGCMNKSTKYNINNLYRVSETYTRVSSVIDMLKGGHPGNEKMLPVILTCHRISSSSGILVMFGIEVVGCRYAQPVLLRQQIYGEVLKEDLIKFEKFLLDVRNEKVNIYGLKCDSKMQDAILKSKSPLWKALKLKLKTDWYNDLFYVLVPALIKATYQVLQEELGKDKAAKMEKTVQYAIKNLVRPSELSEGGKNGNENAGCTMQLLSSTFPIMQSAVLTKELKQFWSVFVLAVNFFQLPPQLKQKIYHEGLVMDFYMDEIEKTASTLFQNSTICKGLKEMKFNMNCDTADSSVREHKAMENCLQRIKDTNIESFFVASFSSFKSGHQCSKFPVLSCSRQSCNVDDSLVYLRQGNVVQITSVIKGQLRGKVVPLESIPPVNFVESLPPVKLELFLIFKRKNTCKELQMISFTKVDIVGKVIPGPGPYLNVIPLHIL